MSETKINDIELIASGLGWPEGPAVLGDDRLVFVESYRSQLTVLGPDRRPRQFAYVKGAPNSCVVGGEGEMYFCQNGGAVGPWRAQEMTTPSIQRVREGSAPETVVIKVGSIALNGPNDLVFAADGRLIFTDPGTYNPSNPDPSYIFTLSRDGVAGVLIAFAKPVFPNGVAVESDGSILWDESYTGHVGRRRPHGTLEDLGRMPGDNPVLDGMKVGADGRIYVTDLVAAGIHVLAPDGAVLDFIPTGGAPSNIAFDGESLWVTNAGVLAASTEPSTAGTIQKLHIPGGGGPIYKGVIRGNVAA